MRVVWLLFFAAAIACVSSASLGRSARSAGDNALSFDEPEVSIETSADARKKRDTDAAVTTDTTDTMSKRSADSQTDSTDSETTDTMSKRSTDSQTNNKRTKRAAELNRSFKISTNCRTVLLDHISDPFECSRITLRDLEIELHKNHRVRKFHDAHHKTKRSDSWEGWYDNHNDHNANYRSANHSDHGFDGQDYDNHDNHDYDYHYDFDDHGHSKSPLDDPHKGHVSFDHYFEEDLHETKVHTVFEEDLHETKVHTVSPAAQTATTSPTAKTGSSYTPTINLFKEYSPGVCRYDPHRAKHDPFGACLCVATQDSCTKGRTGCVWEVEPKSGIKECISKAEQFYIKLHNLLKQRGKKNFAINIRYGATGARGNLPYGPWGPAIIGYGNPSPSTTIGVLGVKQEPSKKYGAPIGYGKSGYGSAGGYGGPSGYGSAGGYGGPSGYGGQNKYQHHQPAQTYQPTQNYHFGNHGRQDQYHPIDYQRNSQMDDSSSSDDYDNQHSDNEESESGQNNAHSHVGHQGPAHGQLQMQSLTNSMHMQGNNNFGGGQLNHMGGVPVNFQQIPLAQNLMHNLG